RRTVAGTLLRSVAKRRSGVNPVEPVALKAVPESGDRLEDLPAALEELCPVEVLAEIDVFQLVEDVLGVLALDAVVPGEKGQSQLRVAGMLDLHQAVFQLLPEPGRRPVLNGEARAFGDLTVRAAVEPVQFVAEVQRRRPSQVTLAQVVEAEAERFA